MISQPEIEAIRPLVKILWDYNKLAQPGRHADLLIVMGTDDERVIDHAVMLDSRHTYQYIVVSGGVRHEKSILGQVFGDTEANFFAKSLIAHGIDPARIIVENEARNTGDNIVLSRTLILARDPQVRTGHLIHTPSMERRALATAIKQWPEIEWSISSQDILYDDYIIGLNEARLIEGIVGDTFRILDYPSKGFQIEQEMPDNVKDAMHTLIRIGFHKRIPLDYQAQIAQQ